MRSNKFIQRVYELEKKYNGFVNIPDDELAKFRKFEKRYFGKSDNKIEKRRKYTRSKRFQDAFNTYLKRTRTVDMTAVEIAKQMNNSPELTDDGRYFISSVHAAQLLKSRKRKYKR
ncbi:hypothetical protein IWT25_02319 [Secundilactobacillus pentosiphilus]|uniref:Uncharacterized protein n=1 Tax=Secundilactobacillus pentosiphilus TaxID=1714682 RepID=A0A1Z5IZS3_9LACO|nr:hypothetical protein [Secundilactobacillus pentosiphilus]GAX06971.1 hypothetical protein IWT25_02319 [Secundilactobacillus pentosiphilus]